MELLADFLIHLSDERRLSRATVEAYRSDLAGFFGFLTPHLGGPPDAAALETLGARDIRAYLATRRRDGLADASVARALSAIRTFFAWLDRERGHPNPSIAFLESVRRPRQLPRPVSVPAARELIEQAAMPDKPDWVGARDAAILALLYGAGLRIYEALALTLADVPAREILRVKGKGNKVRLVPLLRQVRDLINEYAERVPFNLTRQDALFRGEKGGVLSPRIVQLRMQELRGALGLPDTATPHALRHAFASHLLANGADLRAIQTLLGHASLSSTQVYTAVDASQLRAVHRGAHPRG